MKVFELPDLGEGLEGAEIVSWHVGVGDKVVVDQPMVSVETAKAVVEIPAPWSGRITQLIAKTGDIVSTGAPLVALADEDSGPEDSGTVVGTLPESSSANTGAAASSTPARQRTKTSEKSIRVSPAVRRLAREAGIDLASVSGTGLGGTITTHDLEQARPASARDGYEPLRGVRRAMAINMARSAREVPGSTVTDEADVGHWPPDADVTSRLAGALVAACSTEPALNAWCDMKRMERKLWDEVHIAVAINSPDGLFIPVLRNSEKLPIAEIRRRLEKMKADVLSRRTRPEDMTGATISLSNFGMLGGLHAALAIVPPQVAILGAGRIFEAARPSVGEVKVTRILPLSLTFDHRVVTGAEAVGFLNAVIVTLGSDAVAETSRGRGGMQDRRKA